MFIIKYVTLLVSRELISNLLYNDDVDNSIQLWYKILRVI